MAGSGAESFLHAPGDVTEKHSARQSGPEVGSRPNFKNESYHDRAGLRTVEGANGRQALVGILAVDLQVLKADLAVAAGG